jgi:hypothetical protein
MPFTDEGSFYHDRRLDTGDPWKMAAEKLAYDVETYLYDEKSDAYMNFAFITWALARYDATKNSTGNVMFGLTWDPDNQDELLRTAVPVGKRMPDSALRYGDDVKDSGILDRPHRAPQDMREPDAMKDSGRDPRPADGVGSDFNHDPHDLKDPVPVVVKEGKVDKNDFGKPAKKKTSPDKKSIEVPGKPAPIDENTDTTDDAPQDEREPDALKEDRGLDRAADDGFPILDLDPVDDKDKD